jgi:hypothetical protein
VGKLKYTITPSAAGSSMIEALEGTSYITVSENNNLTAFTSIGVVTGS